MMSSQILSDLIKNYIRFAVEYMYNIYIIDIYNG